MAATAMRELDGFWLLQGADDAEIRYPAAGGEGGPQAVGSIGVAANRVCCVAKAAVRSAGIPKTLTARGRAESAAE